MSISTCKAGSDAGCNEGALEGGCCMATELAEISDSATDAQKTVINAFFGADAKAGAAVYTCALKATIEAWADADTDKLEETQMSTLGYSTKQYCAGAIAKITMGVASFAAVALASA